MVALPDEFEDPKTGWNVEGEDLTFIRDEGLELLALYRQIEDPEKRRMVIDLMTSLVGKPIKG